MAKYIEEIGGCGHQLIALYRLYLDPNSNCKKIKKISII